MAHQLSRPLRVIRQRAQGALQGALIDFLVAVPFKAILELTDRRAPCLMTMRNQLEQFELPLDHTAVAVATCLLAHLNLSP